MTIISHQHRFIFLRTRKTASSSVFASSARYAGPEDHIAHVPEARSKYGIQPQNNLRPSSSLSMTEGIRAGQAWLLDHLKPDAKRRPRLERFLEVVPEHMTAAEVSRFLPREQWDSYYKFCFERNPFDRIISLWSWRQHSYGQTIPLDQFIDAIESSDRKEQKRLGVSHWDNWSIYSIGGEIAVDRVYQYEALTDGLANATRVIGLPFDGWLPSLKKGHRKDGARDFRALLSENQRERLRRVFSREMQAFGYDL
jgi:hypothetical protein